MVETQSQSILSFTISESSRFLRLLVGSLFFVILIAMPAALAVLLVDSEAIPFLILAMSGFVLITVGLFDYINQEREISEESTQSAQPTVFIVVLLYTLIALPASATLVVSAFVGLFLTVSGYPLAGLIGALVVPAIDRRLFRVRWFLSLTGVAQILTERALFFAFTIARLPTSAIEEISAENRLLY